ncbi:acyl carrier protein [Actinokineospora diospyrosa]|uniref:Phosphopantetheine attachment site n=1 Tax=Actinokineospora diospyrosa TaxID=103728 RepID=A0ABT1I5Y1_9PSEU|nr:acyl carrier protein [Actinokineospora diospyrosa]MCP2268023.1 Phosphopantetheine attachment site [Actinokineospora diospyrosa]
MDNGSTSTLTAHDEVRRIWSDVLDSADVGDDVNFFEAGGDSLLFIVLVERINRRYARDIDAAELFEHPTVRAQARFLDPAAGSAARQAPRPVADRGRLLGRAGREGGA